MYMNVSYITAERTRIMVHPLVVTVPSPRPPEVGHHGGDRGAPGQAEEHAGRQID